MNKKKILICSLICISLPVIAFFLSRVIIKSIAATPLIPATYDELKVQSFLLQENSTGVSNAQKLGFNSNDMTTWDEFVFNKSGKLISLSYTAELHGTLDLSGCTEVEYVRAVSMANLGTPTTPEKCLTGINVAGCTSLKTLNVSSNLLTSLDLSQNTALTNLYCHRNQLMSLDVGQNTKLTILDCSVNLLSTIDTSQNTDLIEFKCANNQITGLDVRQNKKLELFGCFFNDLTALDVSQNTELTDLRCNGNQLAKLDVSNSNKLKYIESYGNSNLKYINVSGNATLDFKIRWIEGGDSYDIIASPLNRNGRLRNQKIVSLVLFPYTEGLTYVSADIKIGETNYDLTRSLNLNGIMPQFIFAQAHETYAAAFTGWLDEDGNPITEIGSGSAFNNVTDIMLAFSETGNTEPTIYAINYENLEGADNSGNPLRYIAGESFEFKNPHSRENYTFIGWYDRLEGGSKITKIDASFTRDITLYARWQTNVEQGGPPKAPDNDNTPLVIAGIVFVICLVFVVNYLFNTMRVKRR